MAIDPAALRKARIDAGLTLAEAAGETMTKQALHLCETGRNRPTRENLLAVVRRLGVPVRRVLAHDDDSLVDELLEAARRERSDELQRRCSRILRDRNVHGRTRAIAHLFLGRALHEVAPAQALRELRTAYRGLKAHDLPAMAAEALEWQACALYLTQDPRAVEVGAEALARYRVAADRTSAVEARMLEHLGTFLLQANRCDEAIARYREALTVSGAMLELARLANIHHGLAEASRRTGQVRQALDYMERAISFYRSQHDVLGVATDNLARAENDYALQLMGLGRWERAEEMIDAALRHLAEAGVEAGRAHPLLSMGELHQLRGDLAAAMSWTCQAIDLAERQGAVVSIANGYQQLGELFALEGEPERCEAAFARALEVLDRAGLRERRREALVRYDRVRDERQRAGPTSLTSA